MEQPNYKRARQLCVVIDAINLWVARLLSFIVIMMMLTIAYEVVCRYLFNAPTDWAGEMTQYFLCAISMLGGGYALLVDQHVRVDILYRNFSTKRRAIVELATWWLIVIFCLVLMWKGGEMAIEALLKDKRSMTIMEYPLFPSLATVPVGAFLIFIQAGARIVRDVITLTTGKDELVEGKSFFD
jgi:TRAP-type mannitol/chloroaromatic compound transport system permease small subunit